MFIYVQDLTLSNVLARIRSEQIVPDEDAFELLVNSGPNYLQFKLYSSHRIHILAQFIFQSPVDRQGWKMWWNIINSIYCCNTATLERFTVIIRNRERIRWDSALTYTGICFCYQRVLHDVFSSFLAVVSVPQLPQVLSWGTLTSFIDCFGSYWIRHKLNNNYQGLFF